MFGVGPIRGSDFFKNLLKSSGEKFYTKYFFKNGKSISTKVITIIVVVLQIYIWKRSVAL